MDASASASSADDRANELYWGSDMSVNQIADALDLSKGALYEMIRPLAASVDCPSCGAEAVHGNRTAKEKGLIACPECGWGGAEEATRPTERTPATVQARKPQAPPPPTHRQGALAGGLLLGAAAGLALVLWARRK